MEINFAELNDEQLQRLQQLEQDLGVTLIAVEPEKEANQ
jgi:hypothetical protein